MSTWEIREGDCVALMAAMPEASVDAVVCDPPYGLEFMGKSWDRLGDVGQASHQGFTDGSGFKGLRLPTSYNDSANVKCEKCSRWRYDHEGRKCDCGPDAVWPNVKAQQGRAMQEWHQAWAEQAFRVLKPGGHLLAFGGTRTYHRMAAGVEDAGFEIRDQLQWLQGSGFPKSLDVSKAIDKAAGAEREVVGYRNPEGSGVAGAAERDSSGSHIWTGELRSNAPVTPDAVRWQGWGTALKPAHEPIVLARKPLSGTVAGNVLAHGTGALNVDACRIGADKDVPASPSAGGQHGKLSPIGAERDGTSGMDPNVGRWPANVLMDEAAAERLDQMTGELAAGNHPATRQGIGYTAAGGGVNSGTNGERRSTETGGASRFLYVAKASSAERNAGLDGFEGKFAPTMGNGIGVREHDPQTATPKRNVHPTVKPIEVMRWLIRLVTPPGGLVLDPFTGSGTTGIAATLDGFRFVGLERQGPEWVAEHPDDDDYVAIARARVAWWQQHPEGMELVKALEGDRGRRAVAETGQVSIFDLLDGA